MNETTPESRETQNRLHLKPVREPEAAAQAAPPAPQVPVRQGGGHLTGFLALLLAVAVFAFLAQFSEGRRLSAENETLRQELVEAQAELRASRQQMSEARDALGGLRDVLTRIEGLLAPPSAPAEAAPAVPAPAAPVAP